MFVNPRKADSKNRDYDTPLPHNCRQSPLRRSEGTSAQAKLDHKLDKLLTSLTSSYDDGAYHTPRDSQRNKQTGKAKLQEYLSRRATNLVLIETDAETSFVSECKVCTVERELQPYEHEPCQDMLHLHTQATVHFAHSDERRRLQHGFSQKQI